MQRQLRQIIQRAILALGALFVVARLAADWVGRSTFFDDLGLLGQRVQAMMHSIAEQPAWLWYLVAALLGAIGVALLAPAHEPAKPVLKREENDSKANRAHLQALLESLSSAEIAFNQSLYGALRRSAQAWPEYPFHNLTKNAVHGLHDHQAQSLLKARIPSADYPMSELVAEMRRLLESYARRVTSLMCICADLPPDIVRSHTEDEIIRKLPLRLRQLSALHQRLTDHYLELTRAEGLSGLIIENALVSLKHSPTWPDWAYETEDTKS